MPSKPADLIHGLHPAYPGAVLELALPVRISMTALRDTSLVHGKVKAVVFDLAVLDKIDQEPRASRQVF